MWEEGREPGGRVVALGVAIALTAVAAELLIHGEITWLFDLIFVILCVTLALRVRPSDFFMIGVLPPLLMLGVFFLVALNSPAVIAHEQDGTIQALVTGLASHAGALITGYALCLGSLAMRQHIYRKRAEGRVRPPVQQPLPRRVGTN